MLNTGIGTQVNSIAHNIAHSIWQGTPGLALNKALNQAAGISPKAAPKGLRNRWGHLRPPVWGRLGTAVGALVALMGSAGSAMAQMVPDGTTPTQVMEGRIFPTDGGALRGNNLYHSFSQFHVPPTGVVFEAGPVNGAIANNLIVRVTGAEASRILGSIDSRAGFPNANFFLLNPNGIVFGAGARLEVGGSFHASTAHGLRFSTGDVLAAALDGVLPTGNPAALLFAPGTVPGTILNEANLEVAAGRHLTLTAGTVLSTGFLKAPQGTVGVATVAGNSEIVLRSPNAVLSLRLNGNALDPSLEGSGAPLAAIPNLAALLTGNPETPEAVTVAPDGTLALGSPTATLQTVPAVGGGLDNQGAAVVKAGDVVVQTVHGGNVQVAAARNLVMMSPQVSSTGNIGLSAADTLIWRDTLTFPANALAAGNLTLRGDRGIDAIALNHERGFLQSLGTIFVIGDGPIFTDVRFAAPNLFQVLTTAGAPANNARRF